MDTVGTPHPPAAPDGGTGAAPAPVSRRRFLRTAAGTAAAGTAASGLLPLLPGAPAAAAPARRVPLSLTAATNGSATLSPAGDRLVAEVQNTLWSLPSGGGTAEPLTPPDLEPTRPVFSPDGELLALCAYRGGGFHLWVMRPDGSGLRQLTDGPWDDRAPSWSPDGRRLAFASERGGDPVGGSPYRVWTVDVASGDVTRVTGREGQDGPGQEGAWEDFDPVWSPDGRRIWFVRAPLAEGALDARTVASVPADGSGPVATEHTGTAQLMTPAVSPSGRLAYLRTTAAPNASCTLVVDGEPVPLDGDVAPVPPRWTVGAGADGAEELLLNVGGRFRLVRPGAPGAGREIPFAATLPVDRPRYRVKEYDFDGRRVRPVRGIQLPALSPDGEQVAFAALNALWVCGTSGGGPPRKLVQAGPTRFLLGPSWAPDGASLLYADDREGLYAVRRHVLRTGEESVLARGGRVHPALSPDGERLACLDMAGNLVVRELASGAERTLAAPLGGGGLPGRPSWSPDGRFLAFCDRNRLNRRFREGYNLVRVVDTRAGKAGGSGATGETSGTSRTSGTAEAGETANAGETGETGASRPDRPADRLYAVAPHVSVSDRYDSGPVWSPDGRSMAVIVESALWLLPVAADGSPDGEPRRLTDEPADHPTWSGDARHLLYLSGGRLRLLDVRGGAPRTVRVPLEYRRPSPEDTVVHAGRLWDGTGDTVREDADLVVRRGRIAAVEPHRPGRRARRAVDASERTVLPGLWDAHTHPWQSTYGGRQTVTQLAYGITTAVSFGGFAYEQAHLREAVAAGRLAGPRLLTTGELLDGARVAYSMGRGHRTRDGLRRSLERGEALGWDFVKTYVRAPGWVMAEAARFAHERLGVRSGSHLCTPGVQLGQDLTTHLQATQRLEYGRATSAAGYAYGDVEEIYTAAGFHLIATPFNAAYLVGAEPSLAADPRVTALMPPWDTAAVEELAARPPSEAQLTTMDRESAVYRRVLEGGGLVALGTDSPLLPVGIHLHMGLRALRRAGLSAVQALRTATVLPARVFGAERDLGTLEAGKLADVTVVDGDPFTDFGTLVRTVSVLRGGVPYEQEELIGEFPAAPARADGGRSRSGWRAVGEQLRRDGCCEPAPHL